MTYDNRDHFNFAVPFKVIGEATFEVGWGYFPASARPRTHDAALVTTSAEMKRERLKRRQASQLQFWLLPDDDLGADRNALVKVGDVGIDQPEAAG